jgi:hypothetical protein
MPSVIEDRLSTTLNHTVMPKTKPGDPNWAYGARETIHRHRNIDLKEITVKDKIYISIIIVFVIVCFYLYFGRKDVLHNEPFDVSLKPASGYVMSDNLSCTITHSTDKKDIGAGISLIGLESDNPKILFSAHGGTSPMNKYFESSNTITLGLVASGTGGTDMFTLDKKTGIFARTSTGNFLGVFAYAAKGTCK